MRLNEEVRPVDVSREYFASPVDAKIETYGNMRIGYAFTVKNKPYSLVDLLGEMNQAKSYKNGQYIVFYLSPADYHRIHSPIDGMLSDNIYSVKNRIL